MGGKRPEHIYGPGVHPRRDNPVARSSLDHRNMQRSVISRIRSVVDSRKPVQRPSPFSPRTVGRKPPYSEESAYRIESVTSNPENPKNPKNIL